VFDQHGCFLSKSDSQTAALGAFVAATLKPGAIVALTGELGTGKTCFSRGICKGLGVRENVCSPTFALLNIYKTGKIPVYHFDVYRLQAANEVFELGIDEILRGDSCICLIEWADKISSLLPEDIIQVEFAHVRENCREITIRGPGFPKV
jgi:tRNA threonylcarbamoyladenosine biosynthesis protein TsaE